MDLEVVTKVNCAVCNTKIVVTPSRLKRKVITCSRKCIGIYAKNNYSKKIKTSCKVCSKEIFYKKSHYKQIANHTCSKNCCYILKKELNKGQKNPKALKLNYLEKIFWKKAVDIKYRAKAKNIDYDLDYLFLLNLYEKQNKKCYYTNIDLNLDAKERPLFNSLSIDKINPNKGYTKDNVVLCLFCINMFKSDNNIDIIINVAKEFVKCQKNVNAAVMNITEAY